jgi:hypothetical protein
MAELRQILGWKWQSLDEVEKKEIECMQYFNLPIETSGQITTKCIGAVANYNMRGDIDFWYIAYSEPDQFKPVLGDPMLFDITYLDEEE